MTIENLRNDIELFLEVISKESYLQGAGLKDEIKLKEIYDSYPRLGDKNSIDMLRSEILRTDSQENKENEDDKKRLLMLLENLYSENISSSLASIFEKIISKETTGSIEIDGKDINFRSSMIHLLNSDDRGKREIIKSRRDRFIDDELNPHFKEAFKSERNLITEFGFKNKTEMFEKLSGIDLQKLNSQMQLFLEKTESMYVDLLSYFVKKKISIPLSELKQHDLMYLMRAKDFDMYFPHDEMFENISRFISSMGLDIKAGDKITFDLASREKKSPRAFCSTVRIPHEVYLVINPRGGEDDYTAFLHELGHALHYANVDSDLSFEYKWFGDNSVTEGFAMTFDHLTLSPPWMKKILNVDSHDYFIHRAFNELLMLRRHAAKLQYELELANSGSPEDMGEIYSEILTGATKAEYSAENYLNDVDGYFYVARYLRAWMFQANLHKSLKEKYNEDWFNNPSTGKEFRDMWASGQRYNADELLAMHNCSELSIEPLIENINGILN